MITPPSSQEQSLAAKILWWEPLWLVILAPLILLPGRLTPVAWQPWLVMALALFWPLRLLVQRQLLPRTPLNWPLMFILLWLPVNLWASAAPAQSWEAAGYLLLGLAFFMATVNWPPTQRRPQLIAWPLLALSLALALLGPALLTSPPVRIPALEAYQSTLQPLVHLLGETINANILAGGLLIFVPMWTALALRGSWTRHGWAPFLSGLVAVGMVGVIALTGSRGSLLALAVSLPLVAALRWPRLWYGLALVLVGAIVVMSMMDSSAFLDSLTTGGAVQGLDARVEIWSRALYALRDFPFTGIGIGTFNRVIPLLYPYSLIPPGIDIPHAHNLLLQVGVDLGLPGLIAYLALLIDLFVMLWGSLRAIRFVSPPDTNSGAKAGRADSLYWALAAGSLGGLVAMLVHGLLDTPTWGAKLAFVPWVLFALITALHGHMIEIQHPPHQDGCDLLDRETS